MAPATVRGTVFLPALLDVENDAGPVLVAEVRAFRLVSVPSMMRIGMRITFCRDSLLINAVVYAPQELRH